MRVAKLKEAYLTAKVKLWCEDEHRPGLKPIIRKVWSPVGHRPQVKVDQRYEWTYLYAFAHPKSGDVHWLILPTVNADVFSLALEHFARKIGASTKKRVILVLDQAGWHTAKKLKVPEGIPLEFLPSHSPELQPAERLWPLSNEAVANHYFAKAEDWSGLLEEYDRWMHDYNVQEHFSHRDRKPGRRLPSEVLSWVKRPRYQEEYLARAFVFIGPLHAHPRRSRLPHPSTLQALR